MGLAEPKIISSWHADYSAMALSEIFTPEKSVTVWQRDTSSTINRYFSDVFDSLGMGIRQIFSIDSLQDGLTELLPKEEGRHEAVKDIYLLSDMLTCLFNCNSVGLRLAPLSSAMCPRFHTDNIPVRLVCTYLGPGTEWLPVEALLSHKPQNHSGEFEKISSGKYYHRRFIRQMDSFDVGLLKGSAWEQHEHIAAIHRSCKIEKNQKRILLTLDPM